MKIVVRFVFFISFYLRVAKQPKRFHPAPLLPIQLFINPQTTNIKPKIKHTNTTWWITAGDERNR